MKEKKKQKQRKKKPLVNFDAFGVRLSPFLLRGDPHLSENYLYRILKQKKMQKSEKDLVVRNYKGVIRIYQRN